MFIFEEIKSLSDHLTSLRKIAKTVGFVPTMGALHQGHISLVNKAAAENDVVVSSIFVNPTQFNNPDDLKNYPRTPEMDQEMLELNKVDILFAPSVNEIYDGSKNAFPELDLGLLGNVMEGAHRPGHFAGVVQVVSRLFEIVKPEKSYFGEKDFQQLAVIRYMTKEFGFPVQIIGCPTVRESNGLAMSSRNLRLSENGRAEASAIFKALSPAVLKSDHHSPAELKKIVIRKIESVESLKIEYVEIADEETLQPVTDWKNHIHVRCFVAVFCENIRLIDNVRIF
jgi:pantoate--beta-alanine ligase